MLLGYSNCSSSKKILLAEREAMACLNKDDMEDCQVTLNSIRRNARFALNITQAKEALPHSKELRVQAGAAFGLQQYLKGENTADVQTLMNNKLRYEEDDTRPIVNIKETISEALKRFGDVKNIPFVEIVKTIKGFNHLSRRKSRKES